MDAELRKALHISAQALVLSPLFSISIHFIFSPMRMRKYWIFWNLCVWAKLNYAYQMLADVPQKQEWEEKSKHPRSKNGKMNGSGTENFNIRVGVRKSVLVGFARSPIVFYFILFSLLCSPAPVCVLKFYLLCSISIVRNIQSLEEPLLKH